LILGDIHTVSSEIDRRGLIASRLIGNEAAVDAVLESRSLAWQRLITRTVRRQTVIAVANSLGDG
jgi:hypothetical protein